MIIAIATFAVFYLLTEFRVRAVHFRGRGDNAFEHGYKEAHLSYHQTAAIYDVAADLMACAATILFSNFESDVSISRQNRTDHDSRHHNVGLYSPFYNSKN